MKKAIAIVLALTLVFAVTSLTIAAEKKEAAPMEKKEMAPAMKPAAKHVTGDVVSVDAAANTVVVKGKKGDITVQVNDKTKITSGKGKKTLADIKAGENVAVNYTEADGKNTAKSIDIKVPSAEKKAAAPTEKKAAPAEKKK
ncbi:MAG: hypothetical protein HZC11_04795 [Nitrospirae bacterium]|nr:hypothetical protein [Nitrospirota bacterium]